MTRRAALATAGAITIVLLAAAAAIATNLGVLRVATDTGSAGGLSATELAPRRERPATRRRPRGRADRRHQRRPGVGARRRLRRATGPGLESSDDHRSPDSQTQDERYEGRDDDD